MVVNGIWFGVMTPIVTQTSIYFYTYMVSYGQIIGEIDSSLWHLSIKTFTST